MSNKKILCMGSINIDLTMSMRKLPKAGETVKTDNFTTFPGGKGGNHAATVSLLGGSVSFFTKLGDDVFSRQLIEGQKKYGTNIDSIEIIPGQTAGIAMIRVDADGQNSISFTPGANALMSSEDIEKHEELFANNDIFLSSMEIAPDTVYSAIKMAKKHHMTVIIDPAPAPAEGIPDEILSMIDYIKPNETEAEILTGIRVASKTDAAKAALIIRRKGVCNPIITLGSNGLLYLENEHPCYMQAIKVNTVDSTAAGDVFIGSFTEALSEGKNFQECILFARAASALSTTKTGAQTSIPLKSEVFKLL